MKAPIVFISYSHDSDEHRQRVLGLSERLRKDGIETLLDQYVNGAPAEGWPRWMMDQLDNATYVLVVCTETYYRRFRGHEEPGKGRGVDWEGALITSECYSARSRSLKFIPIFLFGSTEEYIPEPLRSSTYYALTSEDAYQSLYDFLLGQSGVVPRVVGVPMTKVRRMGSPLTFASSSPHVPCAFDVSRIVKYAPAELVGRSEEMELLNHAWANVCDGTRRRLRVFTFVALGGEGKTSVVAKWAAELAAADWPGCDAAFAWSFYSQGTRDQSAVSSEFFLSEALRFFGDTPMAASTQAAFEKGQRLAQLIGERRALLILDGLEPLQYPTGSPTPGELKDEGIAALLKGVAAQGKGLCIVTTRYSLPDLKAYWQTTASEHELKRLSQLAGVSMLHKLGVKGPEDELVCLVEDVDGHALTLQIMGTFLKKAFHGDIRCRDRVKLARADMKIQGGHAFRAMAAYSTWMADESDEARRELAILRLLGLFDRPATSECLSALLTPPAIPGLTEPLTGLEEEDWSFSIDSLESAKLITTNRNQGSGQLIALEAHPLLREYFGQRLREVFPHSYHAAHRRLYDYLCDNTREGEDPTLEALQPLYQAVAHGCQAGLQQDAWDNVYLRRIQRGQKAHSWELGAFGSDLGALACYFDKPWNSVSPCLGESEQSAILNCTAFVLGALGRLTEALEPMRIGLRTAIHLGNWNNAANYSSNLSGLELAIGEVPLALQDAEQSVAYADHSGDEYQRTSSRVAHADALRQAGRRIEAEARFREAEQIQAGRSSSCPLLYSVQGFRYCDFLLGEAERRAGKTNGEAHLQPILIVCREVSKRAAQTLDWEEEKGYGLPLAFALHHLTLGRAALYSAILKGRGGGSVSLEFDPQTLRYDLESAAAELARAVSGLRRTNRRDLLPLGLLSRAWLRSLIGPQTGADSAWSDLEEAWEIAERGPMPLHMADIHLYRVRLFFREPDYPWQSPEHDIEEARRLIEKHRYGRRQGDLDDAQNLIREHRSAGSAMVSLPRPTASAIQERSAESRKVSMEESPTIVLLTVNDHETRAVLDAFVGPSRTPAQKTLGDVTYNLLGNHGGMSIVHTISEMGAGGVGASQQRTREAIEHWRPAAVVAVGIAFGMDETKQKIGDVLVSTQIQDYELGRLGTDGVITLRGDKPHASDVLCNRLRQTNATCARTSLDWPKLRFGLVLSGQKLVDNLDYRESLKRLCHEAIGGEMEATGLYVSAAAAGVAWIVVKAICDWGHEKQRGEKDVWQTQAARNAARVLKAAIEVGALFANRESRGRPDGVSSLYPSTEEQARAATKTQTLPSALAVWKEKLAFLQAEEATVVDPAQKFRMRKLIEEAKAKIHEHGGEP